MAAHTGQPAHPDDRTICQCPVRRLAEHSSQPETLVAGLVVELILSQALLSLEDSLQFGFPRITSHGEAGPVEPRWVIRDVRKHADMSLSEDDVMAVARPMIEEVFKRVEAGHGQLGVEKLKAEIFYQRGYATLNRRGPGQCHGMAGKAPHHPAERTQPSVSRLGWRCK